MARVIKIESLQHKEVRLVKGMANGDQYAQYELYKYCADYYYEKYRGVFNTSEEGASEIFQNSLIKFWENIECGKVYVEDEQIKGKDGKRLNGSIRTYFMGIAKLKYMEWLREHTLTLDPEIEARKTGRLSGFADEACLEMMDGENVNIRLEIISDVISNMPRRCYEILTKFYYEEKDLDRILAEIPSITSKNALKTKKYKCMEKLNVIAGQAYKKYLMDN